MVLAYRGMLWVTEDWHYFNYRKVRGPRWSEVITALPQEELKEQLATMTGMDIEVRRLVAD